ncbi:hypothetical protein K493DRAFT_312040 [Basidiobolus meristosporus CBS 931.73]|uniref:Carbohydrate-binding module family 19 domain-containing protein n=1 Tax=Basidiobolus meristosporus CBS 931.73 TaxID=1314790 RepID=A0A1Y1YX03_9FUNG|nr:hypothetical protein K493DRAFT_312040 [Basidiobolus meristosporus CBS 931.73]|eukprot:ORY02499.1 hypothetical protein K493DRAFT_312040 [Basidiobolus meristosporus CBS 931.73]
MRFSTTILAGLFTSVLVSASEPQTQQRLDCVLNCVMEAGLRIWYQYEQVQSNSSVQESLELLCVEDSPLVNVYLKQGKYCLAERCNTTMPELPVLTETFCNLFNTLENLDEPQNAMNSAFTTMFTPVQTPTVTKTSVAIPVTKTQTSKPAKASCINGAYQCVDSGKSGQFTICNNGKLVTQACSAGTVCKTVRNSIICDWA